MTVFGIHTSRRELKFPLIATWPEGKTSKNPDKLILETNFIHNVNFPGKFQEFFSARMVVFSVDMGGIRSKFPLIAT